MIPTRIQRRRTKDFRLPPNTRCINRGTPHGNPYTVKEYGRGEALRRFREYLEAMSPTKRAGYLAPIRQYKFIACFCAVDEDCHGDVILEYLQKLEAGA